MAHWVQAKLLASSEKERSAVVVDEGADGEIGRQNVQMYSGLTVR